MAPAFLQRREGRAEVRDDAVGDLLAGCGVCCRPGAAWGLRRFLSVAPSSYSSLLPGAVAPHPFFLAFVWSCGGVGFLVGCLSVFLLVFHGECGRVW